jgi:hypothetical protein
MVTHAMKNYSETKITDIDKNKSLTNHQGMIEDYIFWISLIEMLFGRQLCSPLCHQ